MTYPFMLSPAVLRFRGRAFEDGENHVHWSVAYSALDDFAGRQLLPVAATLRAGGQGGWADIDVAALLGGLEGANPGHVAGILADSDALETLHDFARSKLSALLGTVNSGYVLDPKAPPAEIKEMTWGAEGDEDAPGDPSDAPVR